jgi:hypothetical protein
MSDERNLGVTEARLGLTILSCLLVALGYFVLQRLGDATESSPVVISPGSPSDAFATPGTGPSGANVQPQILTVQGSEPSSVPYPQTTLRPLWLAPQQGADDARLQRFDPAAPAEDDGEPSLFDSQPGENRQSPIEPMQY